MNENDALGESLRAMQREGASIDEAAQRTGADPSDVELAAGIAGLRAAAPVGANAGLMKAAFLDSIGEERKMGFLATIFSSPLRGVFVGTAVLAAIAGGTLGSMGAGDDASEVLGLSDDDGSSSGATVTPTSTPDATSTPDVTVTPQGTPDADDDDDDRGRNRGPGGGDDDDDDDDDNSGPGNGDDDDDDNSNSGPGGGGNDDDDDNSGSGSGGGGGNSGPGGGDDDDD